MTGSLLISLFFAVGGFIWQGVAYLSLFLATLVVCLLIASRRVWWDERQMSKEKDKLLTKSQADYNGVLERLKPKLEILEEPVINEKGQWCGIQVRNLTDSPCQFGVDLKSTHPLIEDLATALPLSLRLLPETNQRFGFLPARGNKLVAVIGRGDHSSFRLQGVLGIGDGGLDIPDGGPQIVSVTITAFCVDMEGRPAEREFGVLLAGRFPKLWSLPLPAKPLEG